MNHIERITAVAIALVVMIVAFLLYRLGMGKPIRMKVQFENIPCEIKFAIFDDKEKSKIWTIEPGDTEFEYELSAGMKAPFRVIASPNGWRVLEGKVPIQNPTRNILITGADFYLDIDRQPVNEEQNQKNIEDLIVSIHRIDSLSGRKKFFVALVSLQSHFEFLVYGMLVLSGHLDKSKFTKLHTHKERTSEAFSKNNTAFFSNQIEIIPGKSIKMATIADETRRQIEVIFNEIRTLRNGVVHKWGYKDVGRDKVSEIFRKLNEDPGYQESDDEFYANAAWIFVRLYTRTNQINTQLKYFIQRTAVREDREERGYP